MKQFFFLCLLMALLSACDLQPKNDIEASAPVIGADSVAFTVYRAKDLVTGYVEPAYIAKEYGQQVYMQGDTVQVNENGVIPAKGSDSTGWHWVILEQPRGVQIIPRDRAEAQQ